MADSRSSARAIVPLLHKLLSPTSVIDVGCGAGTWLVAWTEEGVQDLVGLDGEWARQLIPFSASYEFIAMDLALTRPLGRTFSLATCLEVAEHLPTEAAPSLVRFLCDLAPVVCFGAAVPGQSGQHHVNEQWPSYWARLFGDAGYVVADLRELTWHLTEAKPWYVQNTLLYVSEGQAANYPQLASLLLSRNTVLRDYVHPGMFQFAVSMGGIRTKELASLVLTRLWRKVSKQSRAG
jgi:SAM-dependent methyltransferase